MLTWNLSLVSLSGHREMSENFNSVLQKLNQRERSDAFLRNKFLDFLNEAQQQKQRDLEERQRLHGMNAR